VNISIFLAKFSIFQQVFVGIVKESDVTMNSTISVGGLAKTIQQVRDGGRKKGLVYLQLKVLFNVPLQSG